MRVRPYSWILQLVSCGTLFFFVWVYLQLFQIPAAIAAEKQRVSRGTTDEGRETKRQKPEERLEKALEEIREKVGRAGEKHAKGEDDAAEREAIKARKIELEGLDAELRKEFCDTETRLKIAKLPQQILDRHTAFVRNYETNFTRLRAELDDIDKARTKADRKAKIEKARLHLEKVRPPKKYVPIDPNKLPFRTVKAKERAPRLKKEEFKRDFLQQRHKGTKTAREMRNEDFGLPACALHADRRNVAAAGFSLREKAARQKPIIVASNGPLAGLLSSNDQLPLPAGERIEVRGGLDTATTAPSSVNDFNPQSAIRNPQLILAQATVTPPTSDDLAETPEVQFTDEIRAKALELGNNPVKIFNWVRNNIIYQPYYGSFKGAAQTLAEGAGNDFDQASLLIALLRVSNIAAKYAYGTVEIPVEKVMNWVGGVSDPKAAGTILSTMGIPATLMKTSGGVYKAVQIEKVWVEAWIDYYPSWGARHKAGGEDTWIPLDPSFKQYIYKQGFDMYALMGFNADEFLESYITDTRDITAYQDYSMRMISFLDANYPDAEVEDIFGASEIKQTKTIVKQEFSYLLGTLPYKVIVKAAQFSEAPSTQDYAITIQIEGDALDGTNGLSYTGGLNDLASKRVTVSYDPASSSDEALIAQYGGNVFSVPPYLINVKPVLRINGAAAATGGPIGMGKDQSIVISFAGPDGDTDRIQNIITAGVYSAIILQSQNTPVDTPSKNMAKLIENSKNVSSPDITIDDLLGQILHSIGVSYFHTLSFENEVFAKTLQLINMRQPSEGMVTQEVKVEYVFGLPRAISVGGIGIDVDRNVNVVCSPMQDKEREKAFAILSGLSSSVSENRILEAFFDVPSVSSIRLLKLASEQGIPVYTITNANLNEVLPLLQVGAEVKSDIVNAVNAGKTVIISKANMTFDQWTGVGYIVMDPITGAASFMISGGLAGAHTSKAPIADPNFKVTWLDKMIFKIVRSNIFYCAQDKIGTPYVLGCTSGEGTDCSGLTRLCYEKAGITLLRNKNAQAQYDYSLLTDDPKVADLVFFKGTYDKNCDGLKDPDDGITHVGIYAAPPNGMIAAGGRGVDYYPINSEAERYPKYCAALNCTAKVNERCPAWGTCSCAQWLDYTSRPMFQSFVGYGQIVP